MKKSILTLAFAFTAASVFAADVVVKETTTTTTGTGTLHEYVPGTTFVVKETAGPVQYRYGKTVTYVTKSGKVLTESDVKTRVKVGAPVRVQYASEGDVKVVNRIEIDD